MPDNLARINTSNITAYAAVAAIAQADGNIFLAAETLKITHAELSDLVCQDKGASELLAAQLKTRAMLKTYTAFNLITNTVVENISTYEPKDAVRAMAIINNSLVAYLNDKTNSMQDFVRQLPEEIQVALNTLMSEAS